MAKANGRIFLQTDGGSRALDRLVDREATATFYPGSVTSDRPVRVTFSYNPKTDQTSVLVKQVESDGTGATLLDVTLPNRLPTPDQARPDMTPADAPTS